MKKNISDIKIKLFVPGRLCLFGEHSDWAGQMRKFNAEITAGQALVVCTQEGIYASASADAKLKITSFDYDGSLISAEYPMELRELQKVATEGGFFSYIAGVAAYMLNYHHIGGLELNCTKITLPQKKGLSSSAAICMLTARAFNRIYGLNLTLRGEMEAAYGGEQLTPSRCGRLDQAVAYGSGIINMCFDGDKLDTLPVKVGAPLYFVFADLNSIKDTITILHDLNGAYPYPQTEAHQDLHKLLGETNRQICNEVIAAISSGNAEKIGNLMTKAQHLFDKYAGPISPTGLKSPILHKVLNDENVQQYTYGGKGVGSQGDGTVQFIAKSADDANNLKTYLKEVLGFDCFGISVPKTSSVRKVVIPLGGYGTRMFPMTKLIQKEFLPIIDADGLAKPMLLILLESLIHSRIDDICLVIRRDEEMIYRQLFAPLPDEHLNKLPENLRQYNENMSAISGKISYAYQDEAMGFGHAVLQSERFTNGEPVLLMLGDHLFRSNTEISCISQLIDAYEYSGLVTIGLFEVSLDEVPNYGIAKIKNGDSQYPLLSALVEKPSIDYAQSELAYKGKYYGIFMYVITPEVYALLSQNLAEHDNSIGELNLTSALDTVLRKSGAAGVIIDGTRYDIGLPEQYKRTVTYFD